MSTNDLVTFRIVDKHPASCQLLFSGPLVTGCAFRLWRPLDWDKPSVPVYRLTEGDLAFARAAGDRVMNAAALARLALALVLPLSAVAPLRADEPPPDLARRAHAVLESNCWRCHGKDGAVEGGMNYVLDRDRLVARRKVVPGKPDESPLFKRVANGKMPPPGEHPRPSAADVAVLRQWIEAGAPPPRTVVARAPVGDDDVTAWILADLEKHDRRSRRFLRYFSLSPLANAGAGPDELETYRRGLGKLVNSLSWHPRITLPQPIDAEGLVLRIDLRDYQWDATLWNRILTDYPYGVLQDGRS